MLTKIKAVISNKTNLIVIILIVGILVLGFYLRAYHINYPTMGYHNIKEGETTSFAYTMWERTDFLRTAWYDCGWTGNKYTDIDDKCYFNEGESPLLSWMLIVSWLILGFKLWVARLVIILFSVFTVIPLYLLVKRLSNNKYFALLTIFFYTILPLSVFFGRNIQPEAPALFFSVLALLFYHKWMSEGFGPNNFLKATIFLVIAGLLKMTFLIVIFSFIFIFPYKQIFGNLKNFKKEYLYSTLILLLPAWLFAVKILMPGVGASKTSHWLGYFGNMNFSILSQAYWTEYGTMLSSYVGDNYSWFIFWIMAMGFILLTLKFRTSLSRFAFGYLVGFVVYIILLAYKWNAHNYYQFPFLPLAAILCATLIYQAGILLKSLIKIKLFLFLPLLLILLMIGPVKESINRQFDTQFLGHDLIGEFMNKQLSPNEYFVYEKGNQNDLSWHAKRFHYGVPSNLTEFKSLEKIKKIKYVAINGYALITIKEKADIWDYIQQNYRIRQAGLFGNERQASLQYLILQKGGLFNMTDIKLNELKLVKTYETTHGDVPFYIFDANPKL